MRIYFAGSIRGGRQDREIYFEIIRLLSKHGTVLTEHVGASDLEKSEEGMSDEFIYTQDINWLKEADVLVAEITTPSLGVGYELGKAEEFGKPVLCLHRGKQTSAMIAGNKNFQIMNYQSVQDLDPVFKSFFQRIFQAA